MNKKIIALCLINVGAVYAQRDFTNLTANKLDEKTDRHAVSIMTGNIKNDLSLNHNAIQTPQSVNGFNISGNYTFTKAQNDLGANSDKRQLLTVGADIGFGKVKSASLLVGYKREIAKNFFGSEGGLFLGGELDLKFLGYTTDSQFQPQNTTATTTFTHKVEENGVVKVDDKYTGTINLPADHWKKNPAKAKQQFLQLAQTAEVAYMVDGSDGKSHLVIGVQGRLYEVFSQNKVTTEKSETEGALGEIGDYSNIINVNNPDDPAPQLNPSVSYVSSTVMNNEFTSPTINQMAIEPILNGFVKGVFGINEKISLTGELAIGNKRIIDGKRYYNANAGVILDHDNGNYTNFSLYSKNTPFVSEPIGVSVTHNF